jgi:CHASE3 domain sensor protein
MSEYITTQQAAALLNTTDRTIRRRLSEMSAKCPQLSAYVRREQGTILIDIRLVRSNFKRIEDEPQPEAQEPKQEPKQENSTTDIVKLLTDQLAVKDSQIKELQERNREQNIIIANMQQERQNLLLSSPIPQPLNDLNNTEKLNNNSEVTAKNTNLQWIILFVLAIIIILLIFLYMGAVL